MITAEVWLLNKARDSDLFETIEELAFAIAEQWPSVGQSAGLRTLIQSSEYHTLVEKMQQLPSEVAPSSASASSVLLWVVTLTTQLSKRRLGNNSES